MKKIAALVSWLALAVVLVPPIAYLAGAAALPAVKLWMLVGTILWFATVPLWMDRKEG